MSSPTSSSPWRPSWLRRVGVTAGLLAPVAVVLVVAWPSDRAGAGAGDEGGPIGVGESIEGDVGPNGATRYSFVGDGTDVRVSVDGASLGNGSTFDSTLTIIDASTGAQLASVDDVNGADPEVVLDVPAGEEATIEVRGYGGSAGSFTISVEPAGGDDDGGSTVTTVLVID